MGVAIAQVDLQQLQQQASEIEYRMMIDAEYQQLLANQEANIQTDYERQVKRNEGATSESQAAAARKLEEISRKEKQIEMEIKRLNTQYKAIMQRIESAQKLVDDNVKRQVAFS